MGNLNGYPDGLMWEFLNASYNLPFVLSLAIMLGLFVLEALSMIIGLGFSQLLDQVVPELDVDIDMDADIDLDGLDGGFESGLHKFFAWLCPGKIPSLVLFTVFLTTYGLLGLTMQWLSLQSLQIALSPLLAAPLVFFVTLPVMKQINRGIYPLLPKDETSAICHTEFIGLQAVITLGNATKGKPAKARLTDRFDQNHYLMVHPDQEDIVLKQGSEVIIIAQEGTFYTAVASELAGPQQEQISMNSTATSVEEIKGD